MLFDQFDKKLKDAADHHHPNYDEKAWLKMEKLLDKHLPVEQNRRRFLFLILFAFFGLGGAGVLLFKPWNRKTAVAAESQKDQPRPVLELPSRKSFQEPVGETVNESIPVKSNIALLAFSEAANKKPGVATPKTTRPGKKVSAQIDNASIPIQNSPNAGFKVPVDKDELKTIFPGTTQKNEDVFSLKQEATPKTDEPLKQAVRTKAATVKNKNKKDHAFFLSITAGPDWVFVRNNKGAVKPFVGAGISYTYNNMISIRTGFYAGRKVYSAGPESYDPPPMFYVYYPYLEKVNANCKVYELPISLSYHFGKPGKREFFASAGVSSFIMKEEAYTYHYKTTPTGPTLNRSYKLKDVNQHQFAELTLSGGYTKGLTRHISITAEPYFKMPLKGVGFGKVKLNSAGLAMSVNVNPFAKKPR